MITDPLQLHEIADQDAGVEGINLSTNVFSANLRPGPEKV